MLSRPFVPGPHAASTPQSRKRRIGASRSFNSSSRAHAQIHISDTRHVPTLLPECRRCRLTARYSSPDAERCTGGEVSIAYKARAKLSGDCLTSHIRKPMDFPSASVPSPRLLVIRVCSASASAQFQGRTRPRDVHGTSAFTGRPRPWGVHVHGASASTGRLRPRDVRVHGGVRVNGGVRVCSASVSAPLLRLVRVCGWSASASGRPCLFFFSRIRC